MLSWKDFQKKFGVKTTSNIDLYKFAKILKIKNFHVIMNDELNTIKKKNPLNVITNLHSSNQPGIHWNCFYIRERSSREPSVPNSLKKYFFDSYGLPPTKEVENFLGKGTTYSTFKIQENNTSYCGQLSLYILYLLNFSNLSYEEIVLSLL